MRKIKINIPEWLKIAADDSLIDSNDMATIFGYKSQGSFACSYSKRPKNIPCHADMKEYKTYRGKVVEKFVWTAKDVRDFIKKMDNQNENT